MGYISHTLSQHSNASLLQLLLFVLDEGTAESYFIKNKANLRDLIAATGQEILTQIRFKSLIFLPCDL